MLRFPSSRRPAWGEGLGDLEGEKLTRKNKQTNPTPATTRDCGSNGRTKER